MTGVKGKKVNPFLSYKNKHQITVVQISLGLHLPRPCSEVWYKPSSCKSQKVPSMGQALQGELRVSWHCAGHLRQCVFGRQCPFRAEAELFLPFCSRAQQMSTVQGKEKFSDLIVMQHSRTLCGFQKKNVLLPTGFTRNMENMPK